MTQILNGAAANDTLTGTNPGDVANPDGIDIINGLAGDDTLSGLGGNDIIQGGLGADTMDGGAGIDTLSYADAAAGVTSQLNAIGTGGEADGDTSSGFEKLIGSAFGDYLMGDGGANTIDGGAGDDLILLSGGADDLDGGDGDVDGLNAHAWGTGVTIDLATGTGTDGLTLAGFEWVIGSAFDDVLVGNASVSTLLVGNDGNDTLTGGSGNDTLYGDFIIAGTGADTLNGGNGDDILLGGALGDALNGGNGSDTAVYYYSPAAVTVDLAIGTASGGHADGDTLASIENIVGSDLNDTLTGDTAANALDGGAGADTLIGGDGIDTVDYSASTAGVNVSLVSGTGTGGHAQGDELYTVENLTGSAFADALVGDGGANVLTSGGGNDNLLGGAGADVLAGGDGMDRAAYVGSAAAVTVNLATGSGDGGDAQGDTLSGIEYLVGSSFGDSLTGDGGTNRLDGRDGDDTLAGSGGDDTLLGGNGGDQLDGGDGDDALLGGDGDDTLDGGAGTDRMLGGLGEDTFVFHALGQGYDRVEEWEAGDRLQIDLAGFGIEGEVSVVNGAAGTGLTGDVFFYQTTSGRLYFHDGETDTLTQFAVLTDKPLELSLSDFSLV